jgi:predicted nuclease with RNAse H fold
MSYSIIGIDVATDPKKCFFSFATLIGTNCSLINVVDGTAPEELIGLVSGINQSRAVLLAIDAPLGWPAPLGDALIHHRAGAAIKAKSNDVFRRKTDIFIKKQIGKQPLDVGADRIARTAHAALSLLDKIGSQLNTPIPLAWSRFIEGVSAIEVYPAATLKACGIASTKYKGKDGRQTREAMLPGLEKHLNISERLRSVLTDNDDALDSAVCVLAGNDFIHGRCYNPEEMNLAKREGWIWVRK